MNWAWAYPAVMGFWLVALVIALVIVAQRENWMRKARQCASDPLQ